MVIDYFSRYIDLMHLRQTKSRDVIGKLKCSFARCGIPEELVSDNGPQFSSLEFKHFAVEYDFKHSTTDPHYPQANGMAEKGVDREKRMLRQEDPFSALLSYRSTPIAATGCSPAELHALMGRKIMSTLPVLRKNLMSKWPSFKKIRKLDDKAKVASSYYFNHRHNARNLSVLNLGDSVRLKLDNDKTWNKPAEVVGSNTSP